MKLYSFIMSTYVNNYMYENHRINHCGTEHFFIFYKYTIYN